MVVTASRREDVLAHPARWRSFVDGLRSGRITAHSSFGRGDYEVDLRPEAVAGLSLWTKAPGAFVDHWCDHREDFAGFVSDDGCRLELQVSITGAGGTLLEPGVRPLAHVVEEVVRLIDGGFPASNVTWRFDPIVVTEEYPAGFWLSNFAEIATRLAGLGVRRVIFSFMDSYSRSRNPDVLARFEAARMATPAEFPPGDSHPGAIRTREAYEDSVHRSVIRGLVAAATDHRLDLLCCRDGYDAANPMATDFPELRSIRRAGCTDAEHYGRIWKARVSAARWSGGSNNCACHVSVDAGRDDVRCGLCRYCYAERRTNEKQWGRIDAEWLARRRPPADG